MKTIRSFPCITPEEHDSLKTSLLFLHVAELRELGMRFSIETKSNKKELIARLLYFLQTGEQLQKPKIPIVLRAKSRKVCELAPEALMLYGIYKNDLRTRLFFKKLIGEHFHFTAFGIDWLNERWYQGSPPTYQEFATMWKAEFQRRQEQPVPPKEEWAYINFTQQFFKMHPTATRDELLEAWNKERERHQHVVNKIVEPLL